MTLPTADTTTRPVVAWIGAPLATETLRALSQIVELSPGWRDDADIVAIWHTEGPGSVHRLPDAAAGAPVFAASERQPTVAERRSWMMAGAEDVVPLERLPGTLRARLERLYRERAANRAAVGHASSVELSTVSRASDAFPALLVPRPPDGIPEEIRVWVDQLKSYLELRDALLGGWSNGVLERYLELIHRRTQVPPRPDGSAIPDTLGEVHGTQAKPIAWPSLIRRGPLRGRTGVEVAEARIVGAGTDGLTLDVPFAASPRQKLVMDLAVDDDTNAQFLLQSRWQRRTRAERWLLGVLVLEMRLRPLASPLS